MDKPVFEVRDMSSDRVYKIWADGRVEGFPTGHVVINRLPQVVAEAIEEDRNFHDLPGEDN